MAYIEYRNGFNGTYFIGGQTLEIGRDKILPYDMTYGAIASCLYSTFLDKLEKRGLSVTGVDADVSGVKRDTVPTTVKDLYISFSVYTDDDREGVEEAFNEALDTCSMVQTFKHVAELHAELSINEAISSSDASQAGAACDITGKGC